ncbi:oligosaccharide flippase family protein [Clostridium tertium]|jgi:O-antigen/teichoic acid export membrane protein|uniref:oligosaccharide flippase family protein n=1 Tax=Clostridium tertium TaxID=1559 RepID=UPI001C1E84C7|nr:oligosaccharide flippase family protein [Clostridium tertium]MBU6134403.1 oligosaccharide flippase family protein [Clostridium tertium]MDU8965441.1 oligosaccharide flippase family protein [Clostridium sp.]
MNFEELKEILKKGLIQIFSANVINKVVQFITIAFLTQIISKEDYGSFTYAQNLMSFVLLFEGAGVTTGILQYCSVSKDSKEKIGILKYGVSRGILVNIILSIGVFIYAIFGKLPIEGSRNSLMMLACVPIFSVVFNSIQVYLRSTFRNTEFSILTSFNTIVYFLATVGLSLKLGVSGLIIGMYIAYLLSIVLGAWFIRKDLFYNKIKLDSKFDKVKFLKYSIVTVLTNAMSQILYLLDTQLIGIFTKDEAVLASYKVATTIPFNLIFIPTSIMVFAYPYFAQNKNDKAWIKNRVSQLTKILLVINLVIGLGGVIFSDLILSIFGKQYLDAKACFNVLMIGYIIAGTFRVPYGNILASLGLVKANFINAIFSGIANIVLDVVLIIKYGSIGAAYATLIVFMISSFIHFMFIKREIRGIN